MDSHRLFIFHQGVLQTTWQLSRHVFAVNHRLLSCDVYFATRAADDAGSTANAVV